MFGYLKKHTLHEISQLEVVSAVQMQLSALVLFVVFIFFSFRCSNEFWTSENSGPSNVSLDARCWFIRSSITSDYGYGRNVRLDLHIDLTVLVPKRLVYMEAISHAIGYFYAVTGL